MSEGVLSRLQKYLVNVFIYNSFTFQHHVPLVDIQLFSTLLRAEGFTLCSCMKRGNREKGLNSLGFLVP